MRTTLTDLLDLTIPIIQAPMAGVSTPALAAAVSSAGGLGSIAIGAMDAAAADRTLTAAAAVTSGPLNVNVFVHPRPRRDATREAAWVERLAPRFAEFGATPPPALEEIYPTLDDAPALLDVLLAHRPAVISLHFGLPAAATLERLRASGARLVGNATSTAEARQLEAAGLDVIVAQGYEAGGHRGNFTAADDSRLDTFSLVGRMVDAVRVPVVAAGGLRTGAEVRQVLNLGAAGAQLGTAFIDCPESAATDAHRLALHDPAMTTSMTRAFSGRPARGLVNRFLLEFGRWEAEAPDYPIAYDAAKALAAAALAHGSTGYSAMWAGQGPVGDRPLPARDLMAALRDELEAEG